jgi:hypothetical protein
MSKVLIWNLQHQNNYRALFNKLNNEKLNIDNYLLKINKRELIKIINNYDLSDSRKESYFFMVARYLTINKPKDNFIKLFQKEGHNLKIKRQDNDGNNELDEKEKEAFKPYSYFIDILKNIKEDDIKDIKQHYRYLILALTILQPTVRTNFYISAEISTNSEYDLTKNYIWLTNNRAYYIINKDKVSKFKNENETGLIEIQNKELVNIIYDSYRKYPRKYLFENTSGEKIKDATLRTYLRIITKLPTINFDIMRSIYITNFYEHNRSYKSRERLAKQMRHSAPTAARSYFKIVDEPPNQIHEELEILKEKINKLEIENNELKQKLSELQPDQKIYNRRRNDMIYRLNLNKHNVKQDTIDKYNIQYNEKTKLYY